MDPFTIATLGTGLAGMLGGGIISGRSNRKNQRLLDDMKSDNEAKYNNRAKRSFLDTTAGKGIMERIRKQYRDANKIADNTATVTGGTDEARIATKGKINEGLNDATQRVAEQATQYQENAENQYDRRSDTLNQMQMNINTAKSNNASNLMSNSANLISTAGAMSVLGKKDKEDPTEPEAGGDTLATGSSPFFV